ncbi:hypothetical protein EVAR_44309_1 [Eumeta japonica]|uniref:Uncharacterized protein n=1 Tax=Eumeta variegata TaxID=151549 RepID=A0A4C1WPJ5_EUMVA|nr:hypothetical protein EVAR_44309_1 [Eumeta japonica]
MEPLELRNIRPSIHLTVCGLAQGLYTRMLLFGMGFRIHDKLRLCYLGNIRSSFLCSKRCRDWARTPDASHAAYAQLSYYNI